MKAGAEATAAARDFRPERVAAIRSELLTWYKANRRRLPWRGDAPPFTGSGARKAVVGRRKSFGEGKAQKTLDSLFAAPRPAPAAAPATPEEPFPKSAYGTWVSEIMLQQTRVEAVIPHFLNWMRRFPTVTALAEADEADVVAQWAGLGYYRRARLLLKGAKHVRDSYGGQLPASAEELRKVPGIGEYTAGAVASIAFGLPEAVVDGNVIRVVARLAARPGAASDPGLKRYSWAVARALVPPRGVGSPSEAAGASGVEAGSPGDFNQAMMELGATVCTSKSPDCGHCPVRGVCRARSLEAAGAPLSAATEDVGDIEDTPAPFPAGRGGAPLLTAGAFPAPAVKKASREEDVAALASFGLSGVGAPLVRLRRRPESGLLAGQWDLPMTVVPAPRGVGPVRAAKREATGDGDVAGGAKRAAVGQGPEPDGAAAGSPSPSSPPAEAWECEPYVYVFSGAKQTVTVRGELVAGPAEVGGDDQEAWHPVSGLPDVGLSSFACKAIATAVQGPLEGRGATTLRSALRAVGAPGVASVLRRSKLLTVARKAGWWAKA